MEPRRIDGTGSAEVGVTRLAPSPTGALHLGNARTFLVTWALARQRGWRIVLRIEDLDGPRIKPGVIDLTIDLLAWLGMDWDEGPLIQSHEPGPTVAAMEQLAGLGLVYPSELTRGQVEAAASAPQAGSGEARFPASLRPTLGPRAFDRRDVGWRFATPDREVVFEDRFAGPQRHRPAESIGDFVVWTARGHAAYQLAVVVDDARQGVTQVVRGDDLLDSAARQMLLWEALGLGTPPTQTHLPLVVGSDGRRLAKRHGDSRLDQYRARGVTPERVIGLVAWWCGVTRERQGMESAEFRERVALGSIPRGPVVFGAEDDAWLLGR